MLEMKTFEQVPSETFMNLAGKIGNLLSVAGFLLLENLHFLLCSGLQNLGLNLLLDLEELEGTATERFFIKGMRDCTTSVIKGR